MHVNVVTSKFLSLLCSVWFNSPLSMEGLLPWWLSGKESACNTEPQVIQVQPLGWEDLEEEMATHASILAWRIPWTKEPDGLQSRG